MSNIFRDRTEGATARRQDLLRRRRDELVTMPHAIRRVYVARRARIAASLAVCLAGAGLVAAASSAKLTGWLASGMPGLNPAVLSTLVIVMWVVGIVVYMGARARDEHRFAVEMSRYVMPGNDLDHDLERLQHEHPDDAAREMAHRLEVRSAALPVIAAAFVLPSTIMYIVHAIHVKGWPAIAEFEANLAVVSRALVVIAILGLVTGIVMTRRIARVPRVAYVAGGVALITGVLAVTLFLTGRKPMSWWLAAPSMILGAVAAVAYRLRVERDLLDADDPAAGSELFTVRGLVRGIRNTFTAISNTLTLANAKRFVCAVGARPVRSILVVGGIAGAVFYVCKPAAKSQASSVAQVKAAKAAKPEWNVMTSMDSKYTFSFSGEGTMRLDVMMADVEPLTISSLAGLADVPGGWVARVTVRMIDGVGPAMVTPFPDEIDAQELSTSRSDVGYPFSLHNCGADIDPTMGLRIQTSKPGRYSFLIEPVLTPVGC